VVECWLGNDPGIVDNELLLLGTTQVLANVDMIALVTAVARE
jgi:hypothetical protein